MRTPNKLYAAEAGFQMLSAEAQQMRSLYEHTVICLMVLVAVSSIVWSVSLHILTGDYNGIFGVKLAFRERDFGAMSQRARDLWQQDLENVFQDIYSTDAALENHQQENAINAETAANGNLNGSSTTKKPKIRKISHLFRTSTNHKVPGKAQPHTPANALNDDRHANDDDDYDTDDELNSTATVPAQPKFDIDGDRKYLSTMTVDLYHTVSHNNALIRFMYSFPFLSELVAIIWTAMCLIYQAGIKKYWGLPKPWRIVIPSIVMFTLMSVSSLVYTIVVNSYLKTFCHDLRQHLSNPNVLSCGQAMTVLRPTIMRHEFTTDVYLNLFRISYLMCLVAWTLALLVMVLRYVFAIDFQLIDVQTIFESKSTTPGSPKRGLESDSSEPEYTEVLLSSPVRKPKLLHVSECHKSEEDFQSAKSHVSEAVTPLLDANQEQPQYSPVA